MGTEDGVADRWYGGRPGGHAAQAASVSSDAVGNDFRLGRGLSRRQFRRRLVLAGLLPLAAACDRRRPAPTRSPGPTARSEVAGATLDAVTYVPGGFDAGARERCMMVDTVAVIPYNRKVHLREGRVPWRVGAAVPCGELAG